MNDDWWRTPFPHKILIEHNMWQPFACRDIYEWLEERGYEEWDDWDSVRTEHGTLFEFRDEEKFTMFVLRWK